jgi:chromosome segregation ATPase
MHTTTTTATHSSIHNNMSNTMPSDEDDEDVAHYQALLHEMEQQLQLAGQAGLELVEENETLNDTIVDLEEINRHEQELSTMLRREVQELTYKIKRIKASYDRVRVALDEADAERARLHEHLNDHVYQDHRQHVALDSVTRELVEARQSRDTTVEEEGEGEEEEGRTGTGTVLAASASIVKQASADASVSGGLVVWFGGLVVWLLIFCRASS